MANIGRARPILASMGDHEAILSNTDHHGPIWAIVGQNWPILANIGHRRPALANMGHCGPISVTFKSHCLVHFIPSVVNFCHYFVNNIREEQSCFFFFRASV